MIRRVPPGGEAPTEGADVMHPTSVIGHGPPHDPVSIGKVRLLGSFGGQIMIEWTLSTPVDDWWIEAFSRAPVRARGSEGFVAGGSGTPTVLPEGVIRWSVPHVDLRNAAVFVLQSVAFANQVMRDRWGAPTVQPTVQPTRVGGGAVRVGVRRG
jgi:hypothetical protein